MFDKEVQDHQRTVRAVTRVRSRSPYTAKAITELASIQLSILRLSDLSGTIINHIRKEEALSATDVTDQHHE